MARPREFDFDEALERAMRVFWAKGYDGASLDDLTSAMQIKRGSLYKAFADKRALYRAALERYDQRVVTKATDNLRDPKGGSGRQRILALLNSVAASAENRADPPGCFLCNASVDQAPLDPDIAQAIDASMNRLERAFEIALRDALPAQRAAESTARASRLTADYIGLRVLARSGRSPRALRAIVQDIVASL